tara:strand:+ start:425 stop:541 length:117 start_codon:yes stop_codon:yes gene_type:complete
MPYILHELSLVTYGEYRQLGINILWYGVVVTAYRFVIS